MGATYSPATSSARRGNTRDGVLLSLSVVKTRQVDDSLTVTIADVVATPVWTENNRLAGGPAEVRVVPLSQVEDDALRTLRREQVASVIGAEWLPAE